jgi:hypothetical protein
VGQNTSEIEQEIREHRADLGRNLNELEDKARELADWQTHYRKHTGVFLSVAFGAGVALGLSTLPKADNRETSFAPDTSHDPYRSKPASWTGRPAGSGTVARAMRQVGDTWDEITDALLRTASDSAIRFVSELVPGLQGHLGKRSRPA